MRIRKNVLPRRLVDALCFLLIGVFLPIVFIFEIIVVLPAFHERGGFWHTFTFVVACFLIVSISGNMLAAMMIDTSVDFKSVKAPRDAEALGWRWCASCNQLAPPRSWHCKVCGTCILKRDHHCLFTGCCIGLRNHRYFMMFVLYLFIAATYAFVYNSLYLWVLQARLYRNWVSVLKMTCPMMMLVSGTLWQNMYLVFYNLNILAVTYSLVLLVYHCPTMLRGGVCYERNKPTAYDAGWRRNLECVFGRRMHLALLSPLLRSELPCDGVEWGTGAKFHPTEHSGKQQQQQQLGQQLGQQLRRQIKKSKKST